MIEATIVFNANRQKVKRYRRGHLRAISERLMKDRSREARARARESDALSDDDRLMAAFKGCDPERTLRLIGDEW